VTPAALGERVQLLRLEPHRYSFLVVNHRRDPLSDPRFRLALSLLWNRKRLADELHRGLVRPIAGPPFGEAPAPAFDLPRAMRVLEEAGYRDTNSDGVRDRGGVPIRLSFVHAAGARSAATEAKRFATDLRRAGLLLEIVAVDPGTILERLKRGEFDLAPLMWEGRADEDPRPLYGVQGEFNHGDYRSERAQGLIDEIRLLVDPAARRPVFARLASVLAAELPVIFLYRHDVAALVSKRVHGLAGEGTDLDLRSVWVEP
jgi:peptide/nickel transport system substrate-binding protein